MNSVQYSYRAKVVRVVDGDTVDFNVDLGFNVSLAIRTRLYGINAPEMNTPEGRAAKAYLVEKLPTDAAVRIQTYKSPTDKYGRWLATVWVLDQDSRSVNDALIVDGHAVAKVY